LQQQIENWTIKNIPHKILRNTNQKTIQIVNSDFNAEIDKIISWKLKQNKNLFLWNPSEVWQYVWYDKWMEMLMSSNRLYSKSKSVKHPFSLNELKNLPEKIQDPIAIFESSTISWRKVALTEIKHWNQNFIWVVELEEKWGKLYININNVYPKDFNWILSSFSYWKEVYVNKSKLLQTLQWSWISSRISSVWVQNLWGDN
jgi:hypothetical protein